MATPNIVYLPGIFGSNLVTTTYIPGLVRKIWISPWSALSGELAILQLAADGVSPGPLAGGAVCFPYGIFAETYEPFAIWMRKWGWNVLEAAYDWRLSIQVSGAAVLALLQQAFGTQPVYFVCHSFGGLVARAVWKLLAALGLDSQVAAIITLGTPHWGSWEVPRGFFGLPYMYQRLLQVAGLVNPFVYTYRVNFLDAILASWPGWYELLPWKLSGPLFQADPQTAAALYQAGEYAGGNPLVSQARLDAAAATQLWLGSGVPIGRMFCLTGSGFVTPSEVNSGVPLTSDAGYQFANGDGQVLPNYGTLPGATTYPGWNYTHSDMPNSFVMQQMVKFLVNNLAGNLGP